MISDILIWLLILSPLILFGTYELIVRSIKVKIYVIVSSKEYFILEGSLKNKDIFKYYFWNCHKRGYPIVICEDHESVDKLIRNRIKIKDVSNIDKKYLDIINWGKFKIL